VVANDTSTVIWRLVDGKPGHDRQSAGLVAALGERIAVNPITFDISLVRVGLWHYARGRVPFGKHAPDPALIIGAGRACQWPLLAARHARGGRAIYLMKPAWPLWCFDYCVIPDHDDAPQRANVCISEGVLNDMTRADPDADSGLILLGGPSTHFGWDERGLLRQIHTIIDAFPDKHWLVTDSRRTPATTRRALAVPANRNVEFISAEAMHGDDLRRHMRRAEMIWVSADSVSMIYEALTTGARVGLIDVPPARSSRISRIGERLAARERVTRFSDWQAGAALGVHPPLDEARRCAGLLLAALPDIRAAADRD